MNNQPWYLRQKMKVDYHDSYSKYWWNFNPCGTLSQR